MRWRRLCNAFVDKKGETMYKDFHVQIFADGAVLETMKKQYESGLVDGFTTNPSLMKKAGVEDYTPYAKRVVEAIPDLSLSFEVFADDMETMEQEARKIAVLGKNVFVKIPVVNTKGESMIPLIARLSAEGVNLNVTAIYSVAQTKAIVEAVSEKAITYVSIFAGRLADNGLDPIPVMTEASEICKQYDHVRLLWASTREVWNVYEAERLGVDIITCPDGVLQKLAKITDKTPEQLSVDTVVGFNHDIADLGFTIR